ncbi:hypothetical protein LN047_02005 [Achromobacter sp. JD417]|uniref:helix-turn-helix domain-containing protein n=1 Tax=Achromobacter sp. JD417 TaxID=2893881 RepID=UPI0035A661D4
MRDVLDCGVLMAPDHETTMGAWVEGHQGRVTRVRLHAVSLAPPPDSLARQSLTLRRYDACILPVAPGSLAWARMALQQASSALSTPILLMIHDVKAPAILDLLSLGAADFIGQPVCLESLRVRLVRLARRSALPGAGATGGVHERRASYLSADAPTGGAGHALAGQRFSDAGELERAPLSHHASHALLGRHSPHAQHPSIGPHAASARPRVAVDVIEHALSSMRHQYKRGAPETFRAAKAQVVNGFEREYIRHALSRHGGNVAQAARACAKHRRAFWALMRKHGIEAAPYRQAAQAAALQHEGG